MGKKGSKQSPETCSKISNANRGDKNPGWKGGRIVHSCGYVQLHRPDHPFADRHGYIREHRLVMETHIGRVLLPSEIVHHVNGDIKDNRIENLMLFSSIADHLGHHKDERKKV